MQTVKLQVKQEPLIDHSLEPLNPHPAFPQWSVYDVYPYQFMGSMRIRQVKKRVTMVYLENEYLRVGVAPDIGGRVWSLYDKISKRQAIHTSSAVYTYNAGFGLNYTCAGLEVNYPLAHSCTTSRKREYRTVNGSDGSASVIIGEYEQIWRTRWFFKFTLRPGRSFLEQTVRIYNGSLHDSRYMYWSNCGLRVNDQVQFIYPEKAGSMHGREANRFSWPVWKNTDLSYWKNVIEPLGLYMLDAEAPFFGYYDHGDGYGLVHYGDLADLPGKKYWSWGSGFMGRVAVPKTHGSDGEPYGEMQAGRMVIQEHLDRMPPESEAQWTEYWFPVRGTDGFNGVGRDAALNLTVTGKSTNQTDLTVKAIGSGAFKDVVLRVWRNEKCQIEAPLALNVSKVTVLPLKLAGRVGPSDVLTAVLVGRDHRMLAKGRLTFTPNEDTGLVVRSRDESVKRCSAEEVFLEGERLARDWNNHDEAVLYREALAMDPGLTCAHLELGKIQAYRGEYESAVGHFKKVIERNPDNLEVYFRLGTVYFMMGRMEDAARGLERSARFDFEARSRTRLAEIRICAQDFHHALEYLSRVTQIAPQLTRPMVLQAICLRKLGHWEEAGKAVQQARGIDPMDPLPQLEDLRLRRSVGKKDLGALVQGLLTQLREYEPPFLEAVLNYGNLGLYADALALLRLFPGKGPIALFYQAYLENQLGRSRYRRTLAQACAASTVDHCVWQLEMIPVLEWAIAVNPRHPRPCYQLGNLLVARRQLEKGVAMWRKAAALGERCHLLYSNLARYEGCIQKNPSQALRYFQKAAQLDPEDLYVKVEIFNLLKASNDPRRATRLLEENMRHVKSSPRIAQLLLSEYVDAKRYRQCDEWFPQLHFEINWPIPGPTAVWSKRHLNEGLARLAGGQYGKAIALFEQSLHIPPNLGKSAIETDKQEEAFYYLGCCYDQMGKSSEARKMWEQCVGVEREYAWEPAVAFATWKQRYFQALALKKLGRRNEANVIFDGMELMTRHPELPVAGREALMQLVKEGRFGIVDQAQRRDVQVQYRAEL